MSLQNAPQSPSQPSPFKIKVLPPPGSAISTLYDAISPQVPQIFRDAMIIRLRVFCDEQSCSVENELDEDDPRSWQWVIYSVSPASESEKPIACIRLVPPPHPPHPNGFIDLTEKPYVKLTRIAVVPDGRGKGLARVLCGEALTWAARNAGEIGTGWEGSVLVHAQVNVERVWERLGFRTDERLGRWDEEGIEHLGMWRQLDLTRAV
jgi:predicted GNAT family N-acyltransferase